MNYPLTDIQIESWSKSINELRPNQDLKKLNAIINMMKIGSIEFNSRLGVQNIFLALKKYDKIKIGYLISNEQHRNRHTLSYETVEKKIFYFEDDIYPSTLIWIIDKQVYESVHLKPTIAEKDLYLQETN